MERLDTIAAVRAWRPPVGEVGFVPTMGALHEGHLTLVHRARAENDHVIVSIFVNPLQFGPSDDLDRYPRDLDSDLAHLEEAGVDGVFFPSVEEMYPDGFGTTVEVTGSLTDRLEAASRTGHFAGVTTVVAKLFQIVQASRAYFGMKDAQQLLVVAKMVRDLAIPTTIVPVPIVRESDGLAMSSRNVYLTPPQRAAAARIPVALDAGAAAYAAGAREGAALRDCVQRVLGDELLLRAVYVSCAELGSLVEWETLGGPALLSVAVEVGSTRLIDNRWLGLDGESPDVG